MYNNLIFFAFVLLSIVWDEFGGYFFREGAILDFRSLLGSWLLGGNILNSAGLTNLRGTTAVTC